MAVRIEQHPGPAGPVGNQAQVAVGDGISASVAAGREQRPQVKDVRPRGEVGDVSGTPGQGFEDEVVGASAAGQLVRALACVQGVAACPAGQSGAG